MIVKVEFFMSEEKNLEKRERIDRLSDPSVEVKTEELRNVFEGLDPDLDRNRNNCYYKSKT